MDDSTGFRSFFMSGFECACQRTLYGDRLNLTAATQHLRWAHADYERARVLGMVTVRDGLQWPVVEPTKGQYDFSSVLPLVSAASDTGTQVVWDLCHFGWPDDVDLFSAEFVDRFTGLARAFTRMLVNESD